MATPARMIYLDNAASTPVAPEVLALVAEVARTDFANPSAAHPAGAAARRRIATARDQVLDALGDPGGARGDVVWTSGGTEGNALGVMGAARARGPGAIVVSALEHPAVAASAAALGAWEATASHAQLRSIGFAADGSPDLRPDATGSQARLGAGWRVRTVAATADGEIDGAALADAIDADTRAVALMLVSNELGSVQPMARLAAAVRARKADVHIHCDATQALGKIAIDVAALDVDSLGVAGHKLHGPKGTGALWLRHGVPLVPFWAGGGQQRGLRHGTQDAAGAAGLGLAAARAIAAMPAAVERWRGMSARLLAAAAATGAPWRHLAPRVQVPHIVSLAFDRVSADGLRNLLASRGVIASSGSACARPAPQGDQRTAPVHEPGPGSKPPGALDAVGLPASWGMVRFSFGLETTEDEVARAATVLADVVHDLTGRAA